MQALLQEAVDLPLEYDPDGRDALIMALLLAELRRLPALPLSLPFPRQAPLAANMSPAARLMPMAPPRAIMVRWRALSTRCNWFLPAGGVPESVVGVFMECTG